MASLCTAAKVEDLAKQPQAPTTSSHTSSRPVKSTLRTSSSTLPVFPTNKKDKRHIKHSNLITRVTKSSASSAEAQRNKRRRQKKQLVTNLESLADALPEDGKGATAMGEGGRSRGAALRAQANVNIIQRKSMKSRPGAMKRREKVDKGERERFAKNLAEMSGRRTQGTGENSAKPGGGQQAHGRWAALRGFIAQTMEQTPELKG